MMSHFSKTQFLEVPSNENLKLLHPVYLQDEEFKDAFSAKSINTDRNKKLVCYVLFHIENQISHAEYDYEDGKGTIEHILPENPSEAWDESFHPDEQEMYLYRLGNLTLIERKKNSECGNKPYFDKLEIYDQSKYRLTNLESRYKDTG